MDDATLLADLTGIVRAIGRIGSEIEVGPSSRLDEDLNLDSLAQVEVILKVEDTYGVTIDEDEAAGLKTIGDLARYVRSRRGAAAA